MPKMSLLKKLASAAILTAASASASAEVITFDGLSGTEMPGATLVAWGGLYTYFENTPSVVGGYSFGGAGNVHWYAGYLNSIIFCGGSNVNCAYNGTDHLISFSPMSVKRNDGQVFSLHGLDLNNSHDDDADNAQGSFLVTGTKAGGGVVSSILTLDAIPNSETWGTALSFNHFDLMGFDNLTSFEISRIGFNSWPGFVIENLNVTSDATAVPEPATLTMFGLGLLGLAASRKRRSKQ